MKSKKEKGSEMGELDGKIAVVTGGSKGIGRATVELFAKEGATIAMCARTKTTLDQVADELREKYGAQVLPVVTDIMDRASVDAFTKQVGETFGRIDMLANIAGESEQNTSGKVVRAVLSEDAVGEVDLPPSRFADMDEAEFQLAFDRKFFGMLRVTQSALPWMRKSDAGSIVNITSTKGIQPGPRIATSAIAWAACMNWVQGLSLELGPENIRINIVSVGGIVTPNLMSAYDRWGEGKTGTEYFRPRTRNIALQRLGTAEEVANAIYFLASPRGAYVTGQCIATDGGGLRVI
jgi:3-oxoacyl-[acyl-carrier protein] reductase